MFYVKVTFAKQKYSLCLRAKNRVKISTTFYFFSLVYFFYLFRCCFPVPDLPLVVVVVVVVVVLGNGFR